MAMIPFGAVQFRFFEDRRLVDFVEDWSRVRSPGRARRRRKLGYPQRIVVREVPKSHVYTTPSGTVVGHPDTIRELKRQLAAQTGGA